MNMYEIWVIINGIVIGTVPFCGSIMTINNVINKVPISKTVIIDNEIE